MLGVSVVLSFSNSFQSKDSHRYGAMAGLMMVEGCRQVSDFCQIRFVDMQDPTKPCAAFRPRAPVLATDSTTVLTTNSTTLLTTDSTTVLTTDSTTTTIPNLPSDADSNSGQSESDSSDDQQNVTND